MKAAKVAKKGEASFDFKKISDDFRGLNPNDPAGWPLAPQLLLLLVLLAATVGAIWYFDWQDQYAALEKKDAEELRLRKSWMEKKEKAVNLDEYKKQLDEIDRQFGTLLKQLPNKAEMDALLSDINQAGLGRGLKFELFKPGGEVKKEFYAEMPIAVRITGGYHDLGAFATDVAHMSRIVTLSNMALSEASEGALRLEATAMTYRYLDADELASSKKSAPKRGGR